jgi:uncharacterized protein YlzI (FlbEa/FlbD family)
MNENAEGCAEGIAMRLVSFRLPGGRETLINADQIVQLTQLTGEKSGVATMIRLVNGNDVIVECSLKEGLAALDDSTPPAKPLRKGK